MKNKKGFTLVECMAAIAIVSIITASAIGVYRTALNSSNKQWNRYISTIMADNALACFQSSENMSDFESRLSELQADGNIIKNPGAEITVTAKYNELVLSGDQAAETHFSKVRAWDDKEGKGGLVQFINDSGTSVVDFSYEGKLSDTEDNKIFADGGVYGLIKEPEEAGITKITVTGTATKKGEGFEHIGGLAGNYDYSDVSGKYDMTYTLTKNSVTIISNLSAKDENNGCSGHTAEHENSKTYSANSLEKELFEKGQFLYFNDTSADGGKKSVYLIVYDAKTKQPVKENNKYICYKISGQKKDIDPSWLSYSDAPWYNDNGYFEISKIEKNSLSKIPTSYSDYTTRNWSDVTKTYSDIKSSNWFFPSYAIDTCKMKSATPTEKGYLDYHNFQFTFDWSDSRKSGYTEAYNYVGFYNNNDAFCPIGDVKTEEILPTDICYEYALKNINNSKISYELKSDGKIEIYAPEDIKLYSYTGNKISDAHNEIVDNCVFIQDTTYSGTSGTEKYTYIHGGDGLRIDSVSYDELTKTIKFMNGVTEVISFEYGTNEAAFENDKPTAQNSVYSTFYENNTIKNPDNLSISVQRIPVNGTSFCYQISLINTDGTQTAIFSTSYGNISTNQGAAFSGPEKTKSVMIDGASYTQYFYYIPSGSNVGCYIMVTFSKVSSGDTSVEPKIKAWILSASDITALQNDSRSDKTQNSILQRNSCYISYRKG